MGSRTEEPVRVRFSDLAAWLRSLPGFPGDSARPFAALLAHYGRRLGERETEREKALRQALIQYLDAEMVLRRSLDAYSGAKDAADDPNRIVGAEGADDLTRAVESTMGSTAEPNDLTCEADLLLFRLEDRRGDHWPVQVRHTDGKQVTVFRWQRGLGKKEGKKGQNEGEKGKNEGEKKDEGRRSFTEHNLLVLLGVSILVVEMSQVDAIDLTLSVLKRVGVVIGGSRTGSQATFGRMKRVVIDFLGETTGESDLVPQRVRAAYADIAKNTSAGARLAIPRKPTGWNEREGTSADSDSDPES